MARILITGSADGLGRASAETLLKEGHSVVVHTRNRDRLGAVRDLLHQGAEAVVGDLADLEQTREVAEQANTLGRMDAVIQDRKSTRLNSSHGYISYAVFCLKKKIQQLIL